VGRLSQAIAEGDGISILVEVSSGDAAGAAERQGADVLVSRHATPAVRESSHLPLLHFGAVREARSVGADAVVVPSHAATWHAAREAELEGVVRVGSSEDLERALEEFDPEILLLSADLGSNADPLESLLALLHDVPAGKLAIAELHDATAEDVAELERAGVDGVLVASIDVAALVGAEPPDV